MSYSQEKQIEHLLQDCLEEEEEDDVDLKICRVCMDKATGYHFNVMTCEGCKGFFRRAVKSNIRYSCPFQNSCVITKNSRRQCQACRLKRCLEIGMNKEMIMSDKAVEERRTLIKKNKTLKMTPSIPEEPDLTKEQEKLLEDLLEAHRKTFDASFTHFTQFRVGMPQVDLKSKSFTLYTMSLCSALTERVKPYPVKISLEKDYKLQRNFSMLPHIADLATYMIQGTINFAKFLFCFCRDLSVEDQISLLKGATFEICQIRFNTVFNVDTSIWECGQLKYSIEDATQSGFQQLLLEPLLNFHCTLRSLKLTDKEYVLMQAISLFSPDRADNSNNKAIELIQEKVAMTLKAIIDTKKTKTDKNNVHLSFRFLFPKIMLILTELRTLSAENNRQILEIQNIQPDVTPLMLEMFGEIG
uniref:Nuclear receptor subfamily 1, group I, member 2 n=1 Tax=Callorhinchus milii TaxID=7868 RepID=A0A4W3GG67_CALMI